MKINNSPLWIVVTACFSLTAIPAQAELIELEKIRAIQDIVVEPGNPSSLLLATSGVPVRSQYPGWVHHYPVWPIHDRPATAYLDAAGVSISW